MIHIASPALRPCAPIGQYTIAQLACELVRDWVIRDYRAVCSHSIAIFLRLVRQQLYADSIILSLSSVAWREILTLGEGFNTQVITLWCFYIVSRSRGPMRSPVRRPWRAGVASPNLSYLNSPPCLRPPRCVRLLGTGGHCKYKQHKYLNK